VENEVKNHFNPAALLVLTRNASWVSDSANVPRLGLRPILLLDFAASDTQPTLLVSGLCVAHFSDLR
jgi:hypothetical protein